MSRVLLHPRFYVAMVLTSGLLLLVGSGLAFLAIRAPPRYFRTTFFEWPIPVGWECDIEGTETVCSPDEDGPKGTIIITTAKLRGPMDTLDAYKEHLKMPLPVKTKDGHEVLSKPLYVREIELGGRTWIDGRHHGSEIPNYDTRYLATVTSRLAVLATYAIHADQFYKYEKVLNSSFEQMQMYEPATLEPLPSTR
ncbi:hypothetical protein QN224_25990 [Sinorhizobium sp. 8-89]|uniref:hypothetical protein n=1 Tax=Sinorhizobium sp. 7-81 TaxID=3049087 RepID=UPI0024C31CB8|nr:hypothetical protein [Sinorhizobium sp. 7-81]MDK1388856.1 hypothetical protein [Sinorhizobium sp. 7-81]